VSWSRRWSRRGALAGLLALAACGELPQPYRGQPGELAARLARPPAYRLAVPVPTAALQEPEQAADYAQALAEALLAQSVPTVAGEPLPLDWVVEVTATRQAAGIQPRYVLREADGAVLGEAGGRMVGSRDWQGGDSAGLQRAVAEGAATVAALVARVDALRRTGDERATGAAPRVVLLRSVRGAPGDGNRSLTARMAERLAGLGYQVQDQAQGAGYAVEGVVEITPPARGMQRVEIVWTVSRRDGHDLGRVLQLNEVPAGSLNGLWGDVAFVVAQEAAGGVRDVIANAEATPGSEAQPSAGAALPATAPVAAPAPAAVSTAAAASTAAATLRAAPLRAPPAVPGPDPEGQGPCARIIAPRWTHECHVAIAPHARLRAVARTLLSGVPHEDHCLQQQPPPCRGGGRGARHAADPVVRAALRRHGDLRRDQ
jgi:hypothetical protein